MKRIEPGTWKIISSSNHPEAIGGMVEFEVDKVTVNIGTEHVVFQRATP